MPEFSLGALINRIVGGWKSVFMEEQDSCVPFTSNGEVENLNVQENERAELKRRLHCVVNDDAELELEIATPPCKKLAKEVSNEDICSEVTDSLFSPRENENTSSLKQEATPVCESDKVVEVLHCETAKTELHSSNQSNPGELTSTSSGNSSTEITSDVECRNGSSSGVSTSHVILEIPKHASTTGIRKITFKFSKSKSEYESKLAMSAPPPVRNAYVDGGVSHDYSYMEQPGLYSSNYQVPHNMELKMSKKVVPDAYPTNVKKLLSTGILEGVRVKYITTSGDLEIHGVISGCGYCCGCSMCNYSKVLSAYEFEQHAGGAKTRHPNNHIRLENGRPIYSIIEALKRAPLGILEEVVKQVAGPLNEGSFYFRKGGYYQYDDMVGSEKYEDGTFLSQSYLSHPMKGRNVQHGPKQLTYIKELAEESKLLKRSSSSLTKYSLPQKNSSNCGIKKRDNDLHRLLFMPNGLPEGAQLSYCVKGQEILSGYKQGNGIVCSHCGREVSPSQFEAHAGWGARRQPYRHIYTSEGFMLHDIAVQLANGQSCIAGHSDDMCAVCGDGGDLTLCPECPRAYHKGCLSSDNRSNENGDSSNPSQENWRCPDCCSRTDASEGLCNSNSARPIVVRLTREIKRSAHVCGGCILCRARDFSGDKFDDRTVIICDQCEKEHHVGCLRDKGICDLKELPVGNWFCCRDCDKIHSTLRELVTKGMQMVPQSVASAISQKALEKGMGGVTEHDMQWQILCGKGHLSLHKELLSGAVSIFREGFNPIVTASGRDLIPVMVYGRNISGQEFAGMYTVILYVNGEIVSAALIRIFGREVAELPLVSTTKENRGKGYFQALLSCIEGLLCSLNVQSLVLPAAAEAKSIWTNTFGFSTMNHDRLLKYTNVYQLTEFCGTSWLEKIVDPVS